MKLQLNLQPEIFFIYRVNPVLHPDILTQVYNNFIYDTNTGISSSRILINLSFKLIKRT